MRNHKTAAEYGITAGQSLEEREYWLKKLHGEWTKSRFHYDYKKVKSREYKPDAVKFNLSDDLFTRLIEITSGSDSKFHMILLTQLVLLLGKYTGSRDIIVGSPIYRQKIKGEFINTVLPLRNQLKKDITFKELLLQVRETIKEAVKNQNYPMDELIYDLDLRVSDDPFPLFEIALLLENIHDRDYIAHIPCSMIFSFLRTGDALEGTVEYDSLLYEKTSIQRIVNHFCNLAGKTLFEVDLPMSAVDVFSQEEKKQLLIDFNNTGADYPSDKTIHELFADQAEMSPGNTALVIWGEQETTGPGLRRQLTYDELNKKANRLARRLREKGVKAGTIVCLLLEPSIEMMVGILGILKAGGAYLPLDTDTPLQRTQTVLEDSAVDFLVTQKQLSDKINFAKEVMDLEDETLYTSTREEASNPDNITTCADLAYVIYTSGSTGIPKGVMIEHRNLLNYVFWRLGAYKQTSEDGCLQLLSVAFDGFCANLYPAILSGGKVVMLTKNRLRDIDYIGKVIKEEKITTFSLTPLLYKAIVETVKQENLKSVKFVIIGGERASKNIIELSNKIAPHITLINEYGPTENSVTTTANIGITPKNVSIVGKPISNNYIYILDENRELKPVGVPGELCVTGGGVARGYLNNPGLTSEKFDQDFWDYQDYQDEKRANLLIKNYKLQNTNYKQITNYNVQNYKQKNNQKFLRGGPGGAVFSKRVPPGRRRQKLYKTGDMARWLPGSSGNIELVGRLDDQLKIKGYRLELGEIETYLSGFHSIKEAVVIAGGGETAGSGDGPDKTLYAYYIVKNEESVSIPEIKEYLSVNLPDFMVPSYFTRLDTIPRLSSGKIDKKALLKLAESIKEESEFVAPRNNTEKQLAKMWKETLQIEEVGVKDSFFNIGGDSIKVLSLLHSTNTEFNTTLKIEDFYENETIEKMAVLIEQSIGPTLDEGYYETAREIEELKTRIAKKIPGQKLDNIEDIYPMSDIQKGMLYHSLRDINSFVYQNQIITFIKVKEFAPDRFKKTVDLMIQKHPMLRTGFNMKDFEEPVQIVYKKIQKAFHHEDISHLDRNSQEEHIKSILSGERQKPLDISGAKPLWKLKTFALDNENICFVWSGHHAILDGWSSASLLTEIYNTYAILKDEPGFVPQPLKCTYKEFVIQQLTRKKQDEIADFWGKELEGYNRFSLWGAEQAEPNDRISKKRINCECQLEPGTILEKLTGAAQKHNTSVRNLCFAAYVFMLNMISYQKDMVVGLVVNNRPPHEDGDKIIGCFLNTIPVRIKIPLHLKWSDYIRLVDKKLQELTRYNSLSLFEIAKITGEKAYDKNPIVDTFFNFSNFFVFNRLKKGESGIEASQEGEEMFKLDLTSDTNTTFDFSVDTTSGRIIILTAYSKAITDEAAAGLLRFFEKALQQFIYKPDSLVDQEEFIPVEEKRKLLFDFNDTQMEYPKDKTINELFEDQVKRTPDNIAVIYKDNYLTYKELNRKANRLARVLSSNGVKVDSIAAIIMQRSTDMIVGIFGILKSGGAYLPINPEDPKNRIAYMLRDSAASIVVTDAASFDVPEFKGDIISIASPQLELPQSTNLKNIHNGADLAYVIYTSGSTGIPKGVLIGHRNVVAYVYTSRPYYRLTPGDTRTQQSSLSFDQFVEEVYLILFEGGTLLILHKYEVQDIEGLMDILEKNQVTLFSAPPAIMNEVNKYPLPPGIRRVILGGAVLRKEHIDNILKKVPAYNFYGPTEATVCATIFECTPGIEGNYPIGKANANYQVYILDQGRKLLPMGVAGEIYISGDGVGRGYLNNQELTLEKFVNNPFIQGNRMFKTGDLGKFRSDGNIEFLGRSDLQIKIRGYRIELGEIENQLLKHPHIKEAVVVARERDNQPDREEQNREKDKYVCAYFVADPDLAASQIKDYLSRELPGYMIPAYFVQLERMPLTSRNKIDKNALPEPQELNLSGEHQFVPPETAVEKKLAETWEAVLGKSPIGITEDFFMIGGDSIKAIQVVSRMNSKGYKLDVREIFRSPCISELAASVRKADRVAQQSTIIGPIPLTPIQKFFFTWQKTGRHHFNQAVMLYSKEGFDEEALKAVFIKIQQHHDALRMTFKEENGEILQTNHGLDYPFAFQVYDFRGIDNAASALQSKANDLQAGICLETGPLMNPALFRLQDGDRLLIVVHHLVIDGVSWRILFEDIDTLYRQYKKGEPLKLPLKSDSFKLWSEKLSAYADTPLFLKEKAYWAELDSTAVPSIAKDFQEEDNYKKDEDILSFKLGEAETGQLLSKVNEPFTTEINDILLTALGLAIKETFGHNRAAISCEGHGREEILKDIDINRTVGWFTSYYPIILDVSYGNDLSRQIKEIKETLRRPPNKGIGYGILKYLTAAEHKTGMEFKLQPQASFNYLGQFDADVKNRLFTIAKESPGNAAGSHKQREYLLDIGGMISAKRLVMTVTYNKKHYKTSTVESLRDHLEKQLHRIIAHCLQQKEKQPTPSDLTYKQLSIPELDETAAALNQAAGGKIKDIYPLSPMQEGMYFHALYDTSSLANFQQVSYRLKGDLNVGCIEKSLNELFKRHDILRTVFIGEKAGRLLQAVLEERTVDFSYQDISQNENKEDYIKAFKEKDKQRSFDLSKDVLMRVAILGIEPREYEFTWSFHHILMDGWCIGILISEFFEIYNSYLESRPHRLPGVKPYRNYIRWLENQDRELSRKYWQKYLDGYEETAAIPWKNANTKKEAGYKSEETAFTLSPGQTIALEKIAGKNHVTLNTVIKVAWAILLAKYNNKQDVVFGALVSGRPPEIEGVESMVGLFINNLPARIRYENGTPFSRLLQTVQKAAVESEPHHYFPLADIQAGSSLKQNLFDHIFVFENYPVTEKIKPAKAGEDWAAIKLSHINLFEISNYDFNVMLLPREQLTITLDYNANLYTSNSVSRIANHFKHVILQVLNNDRLKIDEIEILTGEEKKQLLYEFNDTKAAYPYDKTIYEMFRRQVQTAPDRTAVIFADQRLTYKELDEKAGRLARWLRRKGVAQDTVLGIMVERSLQMMIGIFGILKSGAAYLPIDPAYPQERIDFMLNDSRAVLLLTNQELSASLKNKPQGPEKITTGHLTSAASLAYVIYTSGTTGGPKGVVIEHRSLVNRLNWMQKKYPLDQNDTILQKTTYTFDVSVWEIFWWSIVGAKVCLLLPGGEKDPGIITESVKRNNVTSMHFVPSMLSVFLDYLKGSDNVKRLAGLKQVISSGEALTLSHVEQFNELLNKENGTKLANLYGPTEATIDVSYFDCSEGGDKKIIPIGKPIDNICLYILDKYLHIQPVGITGELCISGIGLARGYLNQPELTVEKFDHDLWDYQDKRKKVPGKRNYRSYRSHMSYIYRTGDLARWLPDGNIEFLGRIDHQVKIRGFRIELEEISSRLLSHEKIKDAFVQAKEDDKGNKYLCAYIVPVSGSIADNAKELEVSELREFLAGALPGYMVPAFFIQLEKIPLTPSGKVDRKSLLAPEIKSPAHRTAPRDQMEETLLELWAEVLNQEKNVIGIDSSFFELGGHSISATMLVSRIHKKLKVKIELAKFFRVATIRKLAESIKTAAPLEYAPLQVSEEKEYYKLSSAQKRFYILQQMQIHGTSYNMSQVLILEGKINKHKLEEAFVKLINRHECLRTSFVKPGEETVQKIHRQVEFEIQYYDMKEVTVDDYEGTRGLAPLSAAFIRPFDLSQAPLLRVGLLGLPHTPAALRVHPRRGTYNSQEGKEDKYLLLIDMHHIIADEISMRSLTEEFVALYAGEKMDPLRIQYKDYSQWQNSKKEKLKIQKQEQYWIDQFKGKIPVSNLPYDYPRPRLQSFSGDAIDFTIDNEETLALKTLAMEKEATLYMVLLAIIYIFLAKLDRQEDIIIGSPVAARRYAELEKIVGVFINTLALRNYPEAGKTFFAFLEEVKERTLKAFENQEYPFEELVKNIGAGRDASRNPLLDIGFGFQTPREQPANIPGTAIPGLKIKPYKHESKTSKVDLNFLATEAGGKIFFSLEYCTRLFKKETVERFRDYFKRIVSTVIDSPRIKIAEIEILGDEEKRKLIYDFNNTREEYPRDKTIHQIFAEQAQQNPDNIAVIYKENYLSYKALNRKANRLARVLRDNGVKDDSIVGIIMQRSTEMIVGIFGILKSGGAYLPINPEDPKKRISYMLRDSAVDIIVADTAADEAWDFNGDVISIDSPGLQLPENTDLENINRGSHLAYVIYTSGSTGIPKGVLIGHRNVVAYVYTSRKYYRLTPADTRTQQSSISFDQFVEEVFLILFEGGKLLILHKYEVQDIEELIDILEKYKVTLFSAPPAVMKEVNKYPLATGIKRVILGGDVLRKEHIDNILEKVPAYNFYGPTEATVCATIFKCTPGIEGNYPIGKANANYQVYILDKEGNPVPGGVVGEIYISGHGLGRGYLNNQELTGEKFVKNPFTRGNRMFRTGDLGKFMDDGNIEFLGRSDLQVKIRGYRIELGEIENRLLKHHHIKEAVVITRERILPHQEEQDSEKDKYVCAYFVSDLNPAAAELKEYLSRELPDYMIPSYFVQLEKMPLTSRNKIDKRALPEPEIAPGGKRIAPRDEIEEKLAEIWSAVLGIEKDLISIDGDFFELGGHSLKATELAAKIHKEFAVKIPLAEIFRLPEIRHAAAYIRGAVKERFAPIEASEKKEYYPLSSAQKRLYILKQMDPESSVYNLPGIIPLEKEPDREKFEQTFIRLINRHESLRTSVHVIDNKAVQRVHDHVEFKIEYYDLKEVKVNVDDYEGTGGLAPLPNAPLSIEPAARNSQPAADLISSFIRSFNLSCAPLIRVGLVKLLHTPTALRGHPSQEGNEDKYLLLTDMHHIISDGISHQILLRDFMALYQGDDNALAPLRVQYKDFSQWQNREKEKEKLKQQALYWQKEFAGKIPVLNLPVDYPRPALRGYEGDFIRFEISPAHASVLKTIVSKEKVTLYMVLLALFNVFLAKLCNNEDIVIGTPAAGRRHADLEPIMGMFVNTLALRNYPGPEKTWREFLHQVKNRTIEAFENQDYPFEELVEKVASERYGHRNPIFDVMFSLQEIQQSTNNEAAEKIANTETDQQQDSYQNILQTSKFDLNLVAAVEERIFFTLHYSTKLFKKETIARYIKNLQEIIAAVVKNEKIKLKDIKISYDLLVTEPDILQDDF